MIGSGIMRAPGVVALGISSPPLILAAWAAGGALAMLSAMPLVEAGSAIPLAGGHYPIAARAFGPTVGFFTGWILWLQNTAALAYISAVFAEYVHRLGFLHGVPNGALACGLIAGVAAINWTGTRISGASQSVASALKGLAFVVLVVALFASPRVAVAAAPPLHPVAAIAGVGALIMAIRVIYQTYSGWDAAIYFSEEVARPDRNVARATFLGIGLVTVLYLLINAAVLHVLPPAAFAGSPLAVGEAAKASMGPIADTVITALEPLLPGGDRQPADHGRRPDHLPDGARRGGAAVPGGGGAERHAAPGRAADGRRGRAPSPRPAPTRVSSASSPRGRSARS